MGDMYKSTYDTDNNSNLDVTAGGSNVSNAADARSGLSMQAQSNELDGVGGVSGIGLLERTGSATYGLADITSPSGLTITNSDGEIGNPTISLDTSSVSTTNTSQTISGLPTFSDNKILVDTISERTATNGVAIDSLVLAKDSYLQSDTISLPSAPSANKLILSATTTPISVDRFTTINEVSDQEIVGLSARDMFFNSFNRQNGNVTFRSASATIRDNYGICSGTISRALVTATNGTGLNTNYGVYQDFQLISASSSVYGVFYGGSSARWCQLDNKISFHCAVMLSSVSANSRISIGLINASGSTAAAAAINSSAPTSNNHVFVRFNAVDGDSSFVLYCNNGATTSYSISGHAISANTLYQIVIVSRTSPSNQIEAYVYSATGSLLASMSASGSSLPSFTADMYPIVGIRSGSTGVTNTLSVFSFGTSSQGFGMIGAPV